MRAQQASRGVLLALLFTVAVLTASVPSSALAAIGTEAPSTEPALTVLNTAPLAVTGEQGKDEIEVKFSALNTGDSDAKLTVRFQASSSERVTVASVSPETIPAGGAQRLIVTLAGVSELGEPATGQLVVLGGEDPVAQSVEIKPAPPESDWPVILIASSLVLAIFVALAVVGSMGEQRQQLNKRAPNPKWTYSSWATTVTAAGAAFGTVLGAATFPEFPSEVSKTELVNLNILFGLMVLIGPFLFETLRKFKVSTKDAKAERTGTNLTMLIASSFTLWAVSGQLGAFGLLGWELLGGKGWAIPAAMLVVVFILLGAWYYFTTMSEQVIRDWAKEEADAKKKEEEERKAGLGCCPQPPATRSWHLL